MSPCTGRRTALVMFALSALTACGSTVQTSSSVNGPQQQVDSLDGSGGSDSPTTSTTGDGGGSAAPGSTDSGSSTTGTSSGGTGASTGSSTGGTSTGSSRTGSSSGTGTAPLAQQASTGLGVTSKTITVGISYTQNSNAANSALGASSITSGDEKADGQAVVDDINAHGGVAGRKLVPVFFAYDATSTSTGDSQDAAACSMYTQDHKVIAVMSGGLTDGLATCLTKAGVVFFHAGVIVGEDNQALRERPNEFLLGTMSQDRYLLDQVSSFQRQKYFGAWNTVTGKPGTAPVKVAVLSYDPVSFQRGVKNTLLPALKAAGHAASDTDVFYVHKPAGQSDLGGTTAQIKSATLKMAQDGITHVVFNDASGLILGLFGSNANTQNYFPRFGVTSGAGAQAIHDAGLVTSAQLNGMSGNGWLPTIDLLAADGNAYANSETKRCLKLIQDRTGQTFTSTNAASIALIACDQGFLFKKAMDKATSLSPKGLIAALESVGSTYTSPFLPAARLSSSEHDNAVRAWDLSWHDDCTCVRYSSQHDVP